MWCLGAGLTCIHCFTGGGAARMQQACDQQSPLVYMKQEGELATTQTPSNHVGIYHKFAMGLQLFACPLRSTALSAYHLL